MSSLIYYQTAVWQHGIYLLTMIKILATIMYYIISSVMYAFWLVLTYGLLEDRHIDDVIIKPFFNYLLYKTIRFQVVMRLFHNRSQMTSKCGKNISDRLSCTSCATFFSYHILMSSVIYYWTDARQLGIYLLTRSYPYFSGSLLFFRRFLSSFYILQAQFSNSFG